MSTLAGWVHWSPYNRVDHPEDWQVQPAEIGIRDGHRGGGDALDCHVLEDLVDRLPTDQPLEGAAGGQY